MDQPQAGPAKPRDEAAIRRKIHYAVTQADDILRALLGGQAVIPDEMRRVRGLLAEWRLETD